MNGHAYILNAFKNIFIMMFKPEGNGEINGTYRRETGLSPTVKYFTDRFVDILYFSVLCFLCLCARLFICALWSPAGKS